MAYTPINWQTGDTITAEKMNKMDNGWGVENSSTEIYAGSLTVSSSGGDVTIPSAIASTLTNTPQLTVSIDGNPYTCTGFDDDGYWTFGAPYGDYSTYPFSVYVEGTITKFTHQTAGTYAVVLMVVSSSVTVSEDFTSAIQAANVYTITDSSGTLNKTFAEIRDAFIAGKTCIISRNNIHYSVYAVDLTHLQIYISASYYYASSEDAYPVYH